jgi:hypothetical protein
MLISPQIAQTEEIRVLGSRVLNGTPTLARPELGKLEMPGWDCSATLITPRHFVTAAHCIDYKPLWKGGGRLMIETAGGTHFFGVERAFSQGDEVGSDDIAVGRLARRVPRRIATPAPITTAQPSHTWLTVMGYGCDQDDPESGWGIKRFKEYWYDGGSSENLCSGDSGGSVFLGLLHDKGPIVRINSGIRGSTGNDIGADAVYYRREILALVRAMRRQGVCYRAHLQGIGWQPAVCNAEGAGTAGESGRLKAIQVWSATPGVLVCYTAHLEDIGWQSKVCDAEMAGTTGQARRLKAIKIRPAFNGPFTGIEYNAYIQNIGWQGWRRDNEIVGTGQSLRMEAIQIRMY